MDVLESCLGSYSPSRSLLQDMLPPKTARHARLQIGVVALLFALFGWGLHYKLSLYHLERNSRSSSVEPAKLLSEAERRFAGKRSIDSLSTVTVARILEFRPVSAVSGTLPEAEAVGLPLAAPDTPQRYRSFRRSSPRSPPLA